MTVNHQVSVTANGRSVPGWKSYNINTDILQPADAFSMSAQFTREAWDLLATDTEIQVHIDNTRILSGFVGKRIKKPDRGSGTLIEITGRDRAGRLVDESAPFFRFGGLHIKELAEKIVGVGTPHALFERVVLVNTRNRRLLRSVRARKAKAVREPVSNAILGVYTPLPGYAVPSRPFEGAFPSGTPLRNLPAPKVIKRPPIILPGIHNGRSAPKKVRPGQTRWSVLEDFLKEARLIAWSTGDGRELFIGQPNYDQEPQYKFVEASSESAIRDSTNCAITVAENIEEMYSKITVVGAGRGNSSSYGRNVLKNRGTVFDNPETTDGTGTGANFFRRKVLVISDDSVKSPRDAVERAERAMLLREAGHIEVTINIDGHSQSHSGRGKPPAIFVVDTMAKVVDEDTGLKTDMYVTAVDYERARGTRTRLRLVPRGTLLTL